MTDQPAPDDEVRQLLVHPVVWPHLTAWLKTRGIIPALLPLDGDDLPTYVMTLTDPAPPVQCPAPEEQQQ
jgi:hypothetical protein